MKEKKAELESEVKKCFDTQRSQLDKLLGSLDNTDPNMNDIINISNFFSNSFDNCDKSNHSNLTVLVESFNYVLELVNYNSLYEKDKKLNNLQNSYLASILHQFSRIKCSIERIDKIDQLISLNL